MQMPARQRPTRKASWEASCSPAWYRCNSLLTIYQGARTLQPLVSSAIAGCTTSNGRRPAAAEAAAVLGTLRGAEHGTNAGTTKRAATKRSGRKELRAMVLKPLVLACTSWLERKQATSQRNGCQLVAKYCNILSKGWNASKCTS